MIVINSNLSGRKWLHTAFHELFHCLLDSPPSQRQIMLLRTRDNATSKCERIADGLALVAILPFPELETFSMVDVEHDRDLADMVISRLGVFTDFGI